MGRSDSITVWVMTTSTDLRRFVEAQADTYDEALAELHSGHKVGHWIWWILPQLRGLGASANSDFYGIANLEEARTYLADPLLGSRLRAAVTAIVEHASRGADAVLGPDAIKLRSSLTLFHLAAPQESLFTSALDVLFAGEQDERTRQLLQHRAR